VWGALDLLGTLREYETALLEEEGLDPTLPLPEHAAGTAEACRAAFPDLDWLHLAGLLHSLGKLLAHKRCGARWPLCRAPRTPAVPGGWAGRRTLRRVSPVFASLIRCAGCVCIACLGRELPSYALNTRRNLLEPAPFADQAPIWARRSRCPTSRPPSVARRGRLTRGAGAARRFGGEPQWAVCGESFPVGCRFAREVVCPQFFSVNPDRRRRLYSSAAGMYRPGCGLAAVYMSWSAAEYLYMVRARLAAGPCRMRKCLGRAGLRGC